VFQPITPFAQADVPQSQLEEIGFRELIAKVHTLRDQLKTETAALAESAKLTAQPLITPL
jgi:hypothetical protein